MSRKIFISYKYGDESVAPLTGYPNTKCRDYVTAFQETLDDNNHINKGEKDDESLEGFADSTIASKLRDKIYDSSVTVVFISKNMNNNEPEKDQWMPWEIAYSLRESRRNDRVSRTNGMIAVVIPDENNKYDYFITHNQNCNCTTYNWDIAFDILRKNVFNGKAPIIKQCEGINVHDVKNMYINIVTWAKWLNDFDKLIEDALLRAGNTDNFEISKSLD